MPDDAVLQEIAEAEAELQQAVETHGRDSVLVADKLEHCSRLLRSAKLRLLDAANMEALARVIRARVPPSGLGGVSGDAFWD